ncbi:MAG TPA: hypothetical protein VF635_16430 [Propionibacteriaceae bacterium]|jgi:hypothetical protein
MSERPPGDFWIFGAPATSPGTEPAVIDEEAASGASDVASGATLEAPETPAGGDLGAQDSSPPDHPFPFEHTAASGSAVPPWFQDSPSSDSRGDTVFVASSISDPPQLAPAGDPIPGANAQPGFWPRNRRAIVWGASALTFVVIALVAVLSTRGGEPAASVQPSAQPAPSSEAPSPDRSTPVPAPTLAPSAAAALPKTQFIVPRGSAGDERMYVTDMAGSSLRRLATPVGHEANSPSLSADRTSVSVP